MIVSVRVDTDQLDDDTWLEWIKDVPPEATKVTIEGIYGSFSTLLLLRMPIIIWSLLPDDTAYTFIGFVTTENLAPRLRILDEKHRSETSTPGNKVAPASTAGDSTVLMQTAGPSTSMARQLLYNPQFPGFEGSFRTLWTCVRL